MGATASADVFTALGVAPVRGRVYRAEEDKAGAERTVVLRESLWRRLFGAREEAIGEKINLSGNLYTIIGVMPDVFQYPTAAVELWTPLGLLADQFNQRGNHPGFIAWAG